MCTDAGNPTGSTVPAVRPPYEPDPAEPVALAPADAVTLTTLVDSSDLLLADQGPVKRAGLLSAGAPRPGGVIDRGRRDRRRAPGRARLRCAGQNWARLARSRAGRAGRWARRRSSPGFEGPAGGGGPAVRAAHGHGEVLGPASGGGEAGRGHRPLAVAAHHRGGPPPGRGRGQGAELHVASLWDVPGGELGAAGTRKQNYGP